MLKQFPALWVERVVFSDTLRHSEQLDPLSIVAKSTAFPDSIGCSFEQQPVVPGTTDDQKVRILVVRYRSISCVVQQNLTVVQVDILGFDRFDVESAVEKELHARPAVEQPVHDFADERFPGCRVDHRCDGGFFLSPGIHEDDFSIQHGLDTFVDRIGENSVDHDVFEQVVEIFRPSVVGRAQS